jgi:hypothetical protein
MATVAPATASKWTGAISVAARADHFIAGGQSRLGDIHAHAAPGTGDEPNLIGVHVFFLLYRDS